MQADEQQAVLRKVAVRLIPFLMVGYLFSFIDRVNLGFAALQMERDVHLGPAAIGFGGGLFFIGYFLFEVPSNLAMQRLGARKWLARIMISWGLVSAATALVAGPWSFYGMRLLLGAAEAGFFPGVLLYLTWWFPRAWRGRVVSLFYVAVPFSSFVGSPLSAAILGLDGTLGLHGWQWVFVIEGLPSILLGIATLAVLPNRPADAKFLSPREAASLTAMIQAEQAVDAPVSTRSVWQTLFHPQVLLLSLIYAGTSAASNGLSLWQPQILRSFGLTTMQTGFVNAIPFLLASVAMVLWGLGSDASGERRWFTILPLALSAAAMLGCLFVSTLTPLVVLLSLTLIGTYAFKGPFWALSSEMMSSDNAPAALAQVNAVGNLAGFAGSSLIGVIVQHTGSYTLALLPLIGLEIIGCVVLAGMVRHSNRTAMAALS